MKPTSAALDNISAVVLSGGSSGIGKSFIELIGKVRPEAFVCNLSRHEPSFPEAKLNLRHFTCDLSDSSQIPRVVQEVRTHLETKVPSGGLLLVNNSGFGTYGAFPEPSLDQSLGMIDLNVRAVVQLTGLFLPDIKRRGGAIINVASTAAFQPLPYMGVYAATKAFVLDWSVALHEELRPTGIPVLALCPGPTETEFFRRAGVRKGAVPDLYGQTPEQVVDAALRALARRKALVVSGGKNKVLTAVSARLPKALTARLGKGIIARLRLEKDKAG